MSATSQNGEIDDDEKKKKGIPPVIMYEIKTWRKIQSELAAIVKFEAKLSEDKIFIRANEIEDYRKLVQHLAGKKIDFHAYEVEAKKPLKVVIKGLPVDSEVLDIEEELVLNNFKPIAVKQFKTHSRRRTEKLLPIFLISLEKNEENAKIYQLTKLMHLKVRVEAYQFRFGISQCHKCQRWGHASTNCYARFRCVKCGEGHEAKECKLAKHMQSKCANCNGEHVASFRGCPKYQAIINKSRKSDTPATPTATPRAEPRNNPPLRLKISRQQPGPSSADDRWTVSPTPSSPLPSTAASNNLNPWVTVTKRGKRVRSISEKIKSSKTITKRRPAKRRRGDTKKATTHKQQVNVKM